MSIAVVVPTIRDTKPFLEAWRLIFEKHNPHLLIVRDGKNPTINGRSIKEIMGRYGSCITNFNGGIRNLGFAYVAKFLPEVETIITLDDDVKPLGDPIKDHLTALSLHVPVSWVSTASEYTRGFPYGVRREAEVVLSHGVWQGVADWDAPTQLVLGSHRRVGFYRGPVPKGVYYPMCSMNLAFKRKMLPFIFHAPWALGVNRFDDIFAGITSKREIDNRGWAVMTGCAVVQHERASDVFKNLENEALGIALNETFWKGDEEHKYFSIYRDKLKTWQEFLISLVSTTRRTG